MKQVQKSAPKPKPPFFGESTPKDEPFILLAQALNVWGSPKAAVPRWNQAVGPTQRDLFAQH